MRQIRPIRNNGSIRIRFTLNGARYDLPALGRWGDRWDMSLARAIADQIEIDIKAGIFDQTLEKYRLPQKQHVDSGKGPGKLLPLWDRWVETLDLAADTKADHYEMVRRMIAKVDPLVTDADWFVQAGEALAAATYNKRLGYLRRCLNWAVSIGEVSANPFDTLKNRKAPKTQIKPFTLEEMTKILQGFAESHPSYAAFVAFMLLTGCRTSEAIGLQWKRVDLSRGELTIADSLPKSRSTQGRTRKSTKTGTVTVLPMNEALTELFQGMTQGEPDALVFKSPKGKPINNANFRSLWVEVLSNQGIPYRKPYTSRHTMASHAIAQGLTLPAVAHLLGHSDARMVMQNYGHIVDRPELPKINLNR